MGVLCCLRHCNGSLTTKQIRTPSDIGIEDEKSVPVTDEQIRFLLNPLKDWTAKLPEEHHQKFLQFLVSSFFDHPESTEVVAFASHCTAIFSGHSLYLVSLINEYMRKQSKEATGNIFQHLSPLLLLRILPLDVFQAIE